MSTPEEEQLQTLPVGHPQAGYLAPKHDQVQGTGTLPPEEQDAWDARIAEQEAQAQAVAANEDAVAKAEAGEAEVEAPASSKSTKSSSTSGSSSSS
jgi:hypothetical protein